MLKVGLVGAGGVSGVHVPAWDAMEDAVLVALCDIRPEMTARFGGNRRCYTDFKEMLDNEQFDIIDICLPTYLHADYAVMAMERGINVICEKPISLKYEDVMRVYKTAEKNNVKFMVAQVLRFWPEYEFLKEAYDSKRYGKLISGSMHRLGTYPGYSWDGWMMDEKRSGMVPYDLHIHDVDFMVYAFGKPSNVIRHRGRRPDQDYVHAVYEYEDFFINVDAAWYLGHYPFTASFSFQFEKALIANEGGKLTVYDKDGKNYTPFENNDGLSDADYIPQSDAYANEIRYFEDCVLQDRLPDKVKPKELETVIDILNAY